MIWHVLGWIGQSLFLLRFLIQWRASERAGRSVATRDFWRLSIGGALLMAVYTLSAGEPVLTGGYLAGVWIYWRNLALDGRGPGRSMRDMAPDLALICALFLVCWAVGATRVHAGDLHSGWFIVVVAGQALWSSRFLLQWVASERGGHSHFPRSFWWASLAGNTLLLAYAVHLFDPLLILAYAFGPVIQLRNLQLGSAAAEPSVGALIGAEPIEPRSPS